MIELLDKININTKIKEKKRNITLSSRSSRPRRKKEEEKEEKKNGQLARILSMLLKNDHGGAW